jgi:hypothetical protein
MVYGKTGPRTLRGVACSACGARLDGPRLAGDTREEVTGCLESVDRIVGIEDRQFRQFVDAVQMLRSTANAMVVGDVD